MTGVVLWVLLTATFLVGFFFKRQPISLAHPLDVDHGLPFPAAGQASTVFSVTAWFGAFLAVSLFLGLPALLGAGFGTGAALFLIHRRVVKSPAKSFEAFIRSSLGLETTAGRAFAVLLALTLWSLAVSELVILTSLLRGAVLIEADYAVLTVGSVALIAYLYIIQGGYRALYVTDVLQFVSILVCCLVAFFFAVSQDNPATLFAEIQPRQGYWEPPFTGSGQPEAMVVYTYQFAVGFAMGGAFMLASPDTWKRVFVVSRNNLKSSWPFLRLIMIGFLPFLLLLPFLAQIAPMPNGPVSTELLFSGLPQNDWLGPLVIVGLACCVMSSFDSALLSSAHLLIVSSRSDCRILGQGSSPGRLSERGIYNLILSSQFFLSIIILTTLENRPNPYIIANYLIGPYAFASGIIMALWGRFDRVNCRLFYSIFVIVSSVWSLYFFTTINVGEVPTTWQVNTLPVGAVIAVLTGVFFHLYLQRRRTDV